MSKMKEVRKITHLSVVWVTFFLTPEECPLSFMCLSHRNNHRRDTVLSRTGIIAFAFSSLYNQRSHKLSPDLEHLQKYPCCKYFHPLADFKLPMNTGLEESRAPLCARGSVSIRWIWQVWTTSRARMTAASTKLIGKRRVLSRYYLSLMWYL